MMYHMKTITIQLTDDLEQRLREQSVLSHATPEQTAADILRRRLAMDRFHDLCRESENLARVAGFKSEDDVLGTIS